MRLATVTSLLAVSAALTQIGYSGAEDLEVGTKFVDPEVQEIFAGRLRENEVPFRQASDGTIWYLSADRARVDRLKGTILHHQYGGNAVSYGKPEHARLFRERLDAEGIRYEIKVRAQREQTSWGDADNPRVQEILKDVRQTIIQEHTVELQRRNGQR